MNPTIYAVVNNDGYVTALVNALLLPEIVDQANVVPAPRPTRFPMRDGLAMDGGRVGTGARSATVAGGSVFELKEGVKRMDLTPLEHAAIAVGVQLLVGCAWAMVAGRPAELLLVCCPRAHPGRVPMD